MKWWHTTILLVLVFVTILYYWLYQRGPNEESSSSEEQAISSTAEVPKAASNNITPVKVEKKREMERETPSAESEDDLNKHASPSTIEVNIPQNVINAVEKCTDVTLLPKDIGPLTKVIESLGDKWGPPIATKMNWINYHLELPSGDKRRLHIEEDFDAEGAPFHKMQFYTVDKEGLPDPLEVPKKDSVNPSRDTVDRYLKKGKTVMEQHFETHFWEGGAYTSLLRENEDILELEMHAGDKLLKCEIISNNQELTCLCSTRK